MSIQISAEGHVHVGGNEWVSLESIQQAVLEKQHPTLNTNCPHCQQESEELFDYAKSPPTKKLQAVNVEQESLELPVLNFKRLNEKQTTNQSDETEHLSLPSTLRRG